MRKDLINDGDFKIELNKDNFDIAVGVTRQSTGSIVEDMDEYLSIRLLKMQFNMEGGKFTFSNSEIPMSDCVEGRFKMPNTTF